MIVAAHILHDVEVKSWQTIPGTPIQLPQLGVQ
jgi:hypothetical protein